MSRDGDHIGRRRAESLGDVDLNDNVPNITNKAPANHWRGGAQRLPISKRFDDESETPVIGSLQHRVDLIACATVDLSQLIDIRDRSIFSDDGRRWSRGGDRR
jgi:hypothetical protein